MTYSHVVKRKQGCHICHSRITRQKRSIDIIGLVEPKQIHSKGAEDVDHDMYLQKRDW